MATLGKSQKVPYAVSLSFEKKDYAYWWRWFQYVADAINLPSSPTPSTVTLGASPAVYQWTGAGQATIGLDGNLTTKVEFSRDGTTYYTVGTGAGMYNLSQGDFIRVTYTGAGPATTLIPR